VDRKAWLRATADVWGGYPSHRRRVAPKQFDFFSLKIARIGEFREAFLSERSPRIIDREFEFYEFFSFLKFNEFYDFFFG